MVESMPLETTRLLLRPPVKEDTDEIVAIADDWDLLRQTARMPHPYTAADAKFFFEQVLPNEPNWAIVWKPTARLIGVIGLAPATDGNAAAIGYYVGRDYWGLGVATEAGRAIVRVGIESFGYRKLTARHFADNPASGRVLAKLGFTVVGGSSHPCRAEGRSRAAVELELTNTGAYE